jgi:hypothetical protein
MVSLAIALLIVHCYPAGDFPPLVMGLIFPWGLILDIVLATLYKEYWEKKKYCFKWLRDEKEDWIERCGHCYFTHDRDDNRIMHPDYQSIKQALERVNKIRDNLYG